MARAHRHRQARLAALVAAQRGPCALCQGALGPIDYDTTDRPLSFTADHILPWAKFPEYRYRLDNLQAAHRVCNQRKGTGDRKQVKETPNPIGLGVPGWTLDDA